MYNLYFISYNFLIKLLEISTFTVIGLEGVIKMEYKWLDLAKKIQAISQTGLANSRNEYDVERYEELRKICVEMVSEYSGTEISKVTKLFASGVGYETPKVEIRAVVFKDNRILMVKEKLDGRWSIPGGWADIGYSPSEIAVKEVREESGLNVKPIRILGVLDKACHKHPPSPYHTYTIFILCEIIDGNIRPGRETSDVRFFEEDNLPELSNFRITDWELSRMFEFLKDPKKETIFD